MSTGSNATPDVGANASDAGRKHTAGAYDVRTVIAGLIGLYGLVLTIMGIVDYDDAARAKTGDVNANLWSGIVMIVVAVVFALWLRLRPVVVDPATVRAEAGEGTSDGSDSAHA
ncbi:MAG: hypothetical protein JWR66_2605 [Modestobacter sp.]|nr:hypothetical protein [Modestobacter sp.]